MNRTTSLPRATRRPARTSGPRRTVAVAAVAIAAALALTGCADASAPGADATSASSSATPSTTAVPTPSDEPDAGTTTTTIATPADGSTVTGPQVEVTGAGTAFEGTLRWRVVTAGTDDIVTENFTTGGANGTVGPFTFTVDLVPGSYTLEIWEPDMSEGEGADAPRGLATTTFTVS